jgi:hypothetical protein
MTQESNNKQEYMTIQQFAVLVGTSKQNIYNQIKGRLEPFAVVVNGRLHILKAAADCFYSDKPQSTAVNPNQPPQSTEINPNQPLINSIQSTTVNSNQPQSTAVNSAIENDNLKEIIEILRQELAAKDKQIEDLHTLLSQQQQLHLATQAQYKSLLEIQQKQEEESGTESPQKRSFFDFFKRK